MRPSTVLQARKINSLPPRRPLGSLSDAIGKAILIGVFATVFSPLLQAADPVPRISPLDREQDLQNKQRQQDEINRQLDKNQRDSQAPQFQLPQASEPAVDNGPKFLISKITINSGDQSSSSVNVDDVLAKYRNRELGSSDLFSLIRDVSNRYADEGYSTTTVSLVPKNMKQGEVELKINWGYVDGWLINGKPPSGPYQKLLTESAMPALAGKPLNIRQVDQMVENLNNAAKTARVDIQPSERLGYSYLNLVVEDKGLPSVTLKVDNSGTDSPSKGRYRFSASTSISDLLLGNDTVGLNLSSRRYELSDSNSEYNAGVTYSVPFGFSKVDLRLNHSQYERLTPGGKYGTYNTSGDSQTYAAKFSHVLTRGKTDKLTASTEIEHKESANYLEDAYLETNSMPYSNVKFGLEHVTQLAGGSLYSDVTFSQGLSAWSSKQAAYDGNHQPKHFQKLGFNTAWSRPFKWLERDFSFSSRIGGQYSKDNLLVAEKMGLGDEFTIRGFRATPLWGDQGVYISNTLTHPMKLLGGSISPLIGLDSGYARDAISGSEGGAISGLAIGASGNWRYGGASITLGLPLYMQQEFKNSNDNAALYMSTYLTF